MNVLNKYETLSIDDLMVNPANDRHGNLEDEIEAMNWILSDSKATVKTLAADIAQKGYVFSAPLVSKVDNIWLLHDGNRRVTCLKMLKNPMLAQDATWQRFFQKLAKEFQSNIPTSIVCRIEEDEKTINDIVFRLHAGGESGVGTVAWNPRQKQNHSIRTGKQTTLSLGVQIENLMRTKNIISSAQTLPIRNLERLLSSKEFLNKVGVSYTKGGDLGFIAPEVEALRILTKVCDDLINKRITIDGLIKNDQKRDYFKKLASSGFSLELHNQETVIASAASPLPINRVATQKRTLTKKRYTLIPSDINFQFAEDPDLIRIRQIIDELKTLPLKQYINATSVLFRVLIEVSTNYYNDALGIHPKSDKIHVSVKAALDDMVQKKTIDRKDSETLSKFAQHEELISANTFHAYVHSHLTTPSEQHLCAMWDCFRKYVQNCVAIEKKSKISQSVAA